MTRQPSLGEYITEEKLMEWAGEKIFKRGQTYFMNGHVDLLFYTHIKAAAEVQGTHVYRVDFEIINNDDLQAECTCPAMQDWGFCKHAVAAALLLLENKPTRNDNGDLEKKLDMFSKTYPNIAAWTNYG